MILNIKSVNNKQNNKFILIFLIVLKKEKTEKGEKWMAIFEKVDTICLKVSDVEKASFWYQNVLGFRESFKDKHYRILSIANSVIPITIEEGEVSPSSNQAYPIFYTKNIEASYERLKENGVTVSAIETDGVNQYFDFYDLDGNHLQACYWR